MPISINGSGSITGLSAGGLPDGSITADDLASSLDLSAKTVTLPVGVTGLAKTGSVSVVSGSSRTYLDIANCFTSAYDDYLVFFNLTNGTTTTSSPSTHLAFCFESAGAALSGNNFSGGATFPTGYIYTMRYAQLNSTSSGQQYGSLNYGKIFGTSGGNIAANNIVFPGVLTLHDVYNNTVKRCHAQGIMKQESGSFLEDTGIVSSSAITGRGLRMWMGLDQTDNGATACSSYGTVVVYGVTK